MYLYLHLTIESEYFFHHYTILLSLVSFNLNFNYLFAFYTFTYVYNTRSVYHGVFKNSCIDWFSKTTKCTGGFQLFWLFHVLLLAFNSSLLKPRVPQQQSEQQH